MNMLQIIRRNAVFSTALLALITGFITIVIVPSASAACTIDPVGHCAGHGYFTNIGTQTANLDNVIGTGFGTSGAQPLYKSGMNRVSFYSGSNVMIKSSFINFIENRIAAGGADKTGGQFIVQTMRGGTDFSHPDPAAIADWEQRVNNPNIEIVYTDNTSWDGWNSGHMTITNDDAYYPVSWGYSPGVLFKNRTTGTVYYKLKTSCANPLGNYPGLPEVTHWFLTGDTTVSAATAAPGQTVTFKHTVTNSPGQNTAVTDVSLYYRYNGATGGVSPQPSAPTYVGSGSTWTTTRNFTIPATATTGETYCQHEYFSDDSGPNTGTSSTAYACVTVSAPPPSAALDGVKIDDTSGGTYAGACAAVGVSAPGCAGTLANYPFSDDPVTVSGKPATGNNYFADSAISSGNHTISVTPNINNVNWHIVGHSICDSDAVADCTSTTMGFGDKYYVSGTATTFTRSFLSNHHYHMRWIYKYFAPGTFNVTAAVTGSGFDDPESPTSLSSTGTATVTFNYSTAPLTAATINLSYTALYTIKHADGSTGAYPLAPCTATLSGNIAVVGPLASGQRQGVVPTSCPASAPPLVAGDQACVVYTFSPATGSIDSDTGAVSNTSGTATDQQCFAPLVDEPYAHFFGLDVSAGGTFANGLGDQCASATPTSGDIQTFVKTGGPLARGSSGQYAALATGSIGGYASASLRTAIPTSPDDLTFANTADGPGNLGVTNCVPDFFATKAASTPVVSSANFDVNGSNLNSHGNSAIMEQSAYLAPGGFTLKDSSGVGSGIAGSHRVAMYITGDVYIQNDIKFKQTNWASVDEIPSFYLIVKGNIFIDPSVSRLDGVYVAQPDSSGAGGAIYTCAPGSPAVSTLYTSTDLYNNCQNQLTVNGAFVAQTVNLLRTVNSLRNSYGGERPTTTGNCATSARVSGAYDCAAEIFNFSPEVYLSHPGFDPIGGPAVGKYDYITSLSPVL